MNIDINAYQFLDWANDAFSWQNETKRVKQNMTEEFCDMFFLASSNKINFIGKRGQTISIEDLLNNNL